ncbi:hypothetical protein AB9P05_00050 [Roseivirga sp. BDSF3-8]|uniref:hypothetical protein n=1 Tax=Roseivirga sp. BDSF3-8 TaxID=3241598 RepID=UPI0035325DB8
MQKRLLLILIPLCALLTVAHAKNGYQKGYLVTLENDTLYGEIKDRRPGTFTEIYDRIRFKKDGALFRKKYAPEEIKSYKAGDRLYESVGLETRSRFLKTTYLTGPAHEKVFLRVIEKGTLTYYQWEYIDYDNNTVWYIPLFHKENSSEMVRVTQGLFGLKKKVLSTYLSDCPSLQQKMESKEVTTPLEVLNYYKRCE